MSRTVCLWSTIHSKLIVRFCVAVNFLSSRAHRHLCVCMCRACGASDAHHFFAECFIGCRSNMVGYGPLSMTGRGGQSDYSGKTAFTLHTRTIQLTLESSDTCSPVPKLNRIVCKLQVFWMMNTQTPNCLMVLRPSASSTSVSPVVGNAGGMRRASWSAAHRGSSCSVRLFLLEACNMVARTLVADGGGGQSDHSGKTALTFGRTHQKTVRHLHLHPHSIMFTNSSGSFFNSVLCSFLAEFP